MFLFVIRLLRIFNLKKKSFLSIIKQKLELLLSLNMLHIKKRKVYENRRNKKYIYNKNETVMYHQLWTIIIYAQ